MTQKNEFISTIRIKTDQLESALESETDYATAKAVNAVAGICRAAIESLPDGVELPVDFFLSLERLKPVILTKNEIPDVPQNYLNELI